MISILWISIGMIHLLMTFVAALQFLKYKKGISKSEPTISIVIAAHNELNNLKNLVPSLLNQNYSDFEIIVALDRSNDGSAELLNEIRNPRLKVIEIQKPDDGWNTKKFALNTAINNAVGEWLVFTDADCIPSSEKWLSSLSENMDDQVSLLIGQSPYQSSSSFLSSYIRFEAFITAFLYLSAALSKRPYMAVGRNLAICRSFFNTSGGYESFKAVQGGDDDLFIQKNATRKNCKVVLGTDSHMETFAKETWSEYVNQKLRHMSVGTNYKLSHKIILSLYHISHLLFWILVLFQTNYQIILGVVLFYLFIKLWSYRFAVSKMGAGFNYILLPLVDILYAILTPMIAIRSKLEKDIRWKN